jgi:hypothetical protein
MANRKQYIHRALRGNIPENPLLPAKACVGKVLGISSSHMWFQVCYKIVPLKSALRNWLSCVSFLK